MHELKVVRAGVVPYAKAFAWQKSLHERRVANEIPDALLLLQHPHVYSLGRKFKREHLLMSDELLAEKGIEVHESDRGGSITYHGPGQLVAYPIVDLRRPGRDHPDAIRYLRLLEEAIIRTVRSYGIVAQRREGLTGVWVGESKLAAIGVNVSRGVTRHGLALNVTTNLEYFNGMIPCGIPDAAVTSLQAILLKAPPMEEVESSLASHLGKLLYRRAIPGSLTGLGLSEDEFKVIEFDKAKGAPRSKNMPARKRKAQPPGNQSGASGAKS